MTNQAKKTCPIPGCNHHFASGTIGWFRHIAEVARHPYWHTDVADHNARKELFRAEYPEFLALQSEPPATSPAHVMPSSIPPGVDLETLAKAIATELVAKLITSPPPSYRRPASRTMRKVVGR